MTILTAHHRKQTSGLLADNSIMLGERFCLVLPLRVPAAHVGQHLKLLHARHTRHPVCLAAAPGQSGLLHVPSGEQLSSLAETDSDVASLQRSSGSDWHPFAEVATTPFAGSSDLARYSVGCLPLASLYPVSCWADAYRLKQLTVTNARWWMPVWVRICQRL